MPLRFDLGAFEELHIGRCVIKNSHERSLFVVEGDMPIMKGKEYVPETAAHSVLEKFYRCVQQMYLQEATEKYQGQYLQWAAQAMRQNPDLCSDLEAADQLIKAGDFYRALKGLRKLLGPDVFRAVERGPSANYVPRVNGWKRNG